MSVKLPNFYFAFTGENRNSATLKFIFFFKTALCVIFFYFAIMYPTKKKLGYMNRVRQF